MNKILFFMIAGSIFLVCFSIYGFKIAVFSDMISPSRKKELLKDLSGEQKQKMLNKIKRHIWGFRIFFIVNPILVSYLIIIPTCQDTYLFIMNKVPVFSGEVTHVSEGKNVLSGYDIYVETSSGEIKLSVSNKRVKVGDHVYGEYFPNTEFGKIYELGFPE